MTTRVLESIYFFATIDRSLVLKIKIFQIEKRLSRRVLYITLLYKIPFNDPFKIDVTLSINAFLAHLSRRLVGELIVHGGIRRPSVRRRP